MKDVPNFKVEECTLIDLLVNNKIASSRREAREFLNAGSITINGNKVNDENLVVTKSLTIEEKVLVIRKGKKKYYMGIFE